jgi:hypothetical protein
VIRLGAGGTALLGVAVSASIGLGLAWLSGHHFDRGYAAREAELHAVRQAIERELQRQAQISRQAAEAIRIAENTRDRAIQEDLDALPSHARELRLDPDALRLLRSIQ